MKYLLLLLFFFIICCEFSDENLQGPLAGISEDENINSNDDDDGEEDTNPKKYIASIEEDQDGATAIRIEPAPDFTNERENVKGLLTFLLIYFVMNCIKGKVNIFLGKYAVQSFY